MIRSEGTRSWQRMYKASGVQGDDRSLYISGQDAAEDGLEGTPLQLFLAGLTERAKGLFLMGYNSRVSCNETGATTQDGVVDAFREPVRQEMRTIV